MNRQRRALVFGGLLPGILLCAQGAAAPDSFRFAILGDRTGEAQRGVYEQVCREVAAESPAFAVSAMGAMVGPPLRVKDALMLSCVFCATF